MTLEIRPICGAAYVTSPAICRKSASIGVIRGEWNAWETVSGLVRMPAAFSAVMMVSTSSHCPESTTRSGPLTAATETVSAWGRISSSTCASLADTATIMPSWGNACISRARSATSLRPSSRLNTPATHAATYSPTL